MVVFSIMLVISCKKKDNSAITVTIYAPLQGMVYNVGDTIKIKAHVSSVNALKTGDIALLDANYINNDATLAVSVAGNEADVNANYILTNEKLNTGSYYIQVQATDGNTVGKAFQNVFIHAVPLAKKGVFVVTGSNNANTKVYTFDQNNTILPVVSLNGDFGNASVSNNDQCMYTCGIYSGPFSNINLLSYAIDWNILAGSGILPSFENVYSHDRLTFLADYNQNIIGYAKNKSIGFHALTNVGTYAHTLYADAQYLYAEQRSYAGNDIRMVLYRLTTSAAYQEVAINQDIKAIFTINKDSLMLFTNANGVGYAKIYNIVSNSIVNSYPMANGALLSVAQIGPSQYIVGHQNGIYIYSTNMMGSETLFDATNAATCIRYEPIGSQLFVATANNLKTINFPNATVANMLTFPDTLKDIGVLYNH